MAKKPNILVMWGDDIGQSNLSCFTKGMMGYRTPNIDRVANEGMVFTDYYAEQSCTAGRASFITGQCGFRTGLTKVGMPGAKEGMKDTIPTIASVLKAQGCATGQFGKNHLGDRDEQLPTMHGFDEFFGNHYHLNAEEEPENPDYPDAKEFPNFRTRFGPRGVLHCKADGKGGQSIEDTGPLTKQRRETIDDEVTDEAIAVEVGLEGFAVERGALLKVFLDRGGPRHLGEGRQPVEVRDDVVGDRASGNLARPAHHGGHPIPSQLVFFSDRNGVVPASGQELQCGPLSVEYMTKVSSATPSSSTRSSSTPIALS